MKVISIGAYKGSTNSYKAQFELLIGLRKQEVDITVMANFSDEILKCFQDANVPVIHDFPETKVDLEYVKRVKEVISENNFDIIHLFNGKVTRNVILATKELNVKVIAYMGSVSLHWHDPSAYLTYLSSRNDKIICNSNYVYNHVRKQLFGKRRQKAVRIYKGYDSGWFKNVIPFDYSSLGIDKNAIVVCMAANYLKVKGVEFFIESSYHIKSAKEIHYVMLGKDCDNPKILKLVNNSPIKNNIHLLGHRADVISLIKAADIYAQTSLKEGFGRAISEAMCVGKPIIMTNAGGCTELIDKNSGIVVPVKDSRSTGEAISKLADKETLRKQMGIAAKERIETIYNIKKTIEETKELYNTLMLN